MDTLQNIGTIPDAQHVVNAPSEESYDDVPYGSHPIPASHPDRLYNVAKLYGLSPVPPENARILELGCAGGGNLLPIASQFPQSHCFGIDLSEVQCANARTAINYTRLKNVEIIQGSIADIGPKQGKFDYIICHGVYSWVPDFVRTEILRVASENLSENGVAFISYNVLPGWYFRGMIRGMLLQHTAEIDNNRTKILQSRALLDFLMLATQHQNTAHAAFIRDEAKTMNRLPDEYLFHEHLEANNQAFFFRDFIKDAEKTNLQFLGESTLSHSWLGNFSEAAIAKLSKIDDAVLLGHYTDCIAGRMFRETLLVHASAKIERKISAERLAGIRFSGHFSPAPTPTAGQAPSNVPSNKQERHFVTADNASLRTADKLMISIIETITAAYPGSVSMDELITAAESKLAKQNETLPAFDLNALTSELFLWTMKGILQFQYHPDRMLLKQVTTPKVAPWFLSQAQAGTHATNLQHRLVEISEVQKALIPMMDGSNKLQDFVQHTEFLVRANLIKIEPRFERIKLTPNFISELACDALKNLGAKCAFLPD